MALADSNLYRNLWDGWGNRLLTLTALGILGMIVLGLWHWVTAIAQWQVVQVNLAFLTVGFYPSEQWWRLWLIGYMTFGLSGFSWGWWGQRQWWTGILVPIMVLLAAQVSSSWGWCGLLLSGGVIAGLWLRRSPLVCRGVSRLLAALWLALVPLSLWLIGGGWGLALVPREQWNGLLLTLMLAVLSIGGTLPLGILLALGRQSPLPVFRGAAVLYIELVRGVPLVGVLFVAQVMVPLILPTGWTVDRVTRAIAAFIIFSAAYLAENVRSGIQAVPRGQWEAAQSLGLAPPLIWGLIILPQALRIAVPAMVTQFIALFKDTSLVAIAGLIDLMGASRSVLSQPEFFNRAPELYSFLALVYGGLCFMLSQGSKALELRQSSDLR
ncbi:MAG: amino acid ABC transporter permease [Oscillatoriales cyanobacterium SM2_2_1]|nr:amino acid ABC transporter permease [Oscillatoriales cyanobacterium SM2_2_1]